MSDDPSRGTQTRRLWRGALLRLAIFAPLAVACSPVSACGPDSDCVVANGRYRYGVGVGREGLEFKGSANIALKREWPHWTPTPDMIKREPDRYAKWAGGMEGGPRNPLGARALYLFKNGKDTLFRIHGTTEPWTIGTAVSSGCIRMVNQDVVDIYSRIPLGSKVVVH